MTVEEGTSSLTLSFRSARSEISAETHEEQPSLVAPSTSTDDDQEDYDAEQTQVRAPDVAAFPPQSTSNASSDLHADYEAPQSQVTTNEEVVSPPQSAANTSSGSNLSRVLQSQQRRERFKQKMKLMNEGSREEETGRQSQAPDPSRGDGVSTNSENDAAVAETSRTSTKAKSVPGEKRRLRNSAFLGSQAGRAHLRNSPGEVLLEPDLDCQPSGDFCADDMVGSAVKPVTLVDYAPRKCAPTSHSNSAHDSENKDMSPGAVCVQGRAFGAPRRPQSVDQRTINASSEAEGEGSRLPRVLSQASGRNASTGTEVIAETVDAEAMVYASDVVKMRPKWVYYALGAVVISIILALALGMGLALNNDNNNDDLQDEPRCLDILDICFCEEGDASLLSLSENETKFYDFASDELVRLGVVNHTFDRDDCAYAHQVILSIANLQRLRIYNDSDISLVVGDIELLETEKKKKKRGEDFLIQQFILRLLYLETNGDKWSDNVGWKTAFCICNWKGIKCNSKKQVLGIVLPAIGLNGTLPWQIGKMPFLTKLDLSFNPGLIGTFPSEIGNCSALHVIDMAMSGLSGSLPTELAELKSLIRLTMAGNSFVGTIPTEYGRFQRMRAFNLDNNQLTGSLPSELGSMNSIEFFFVGNNQLNGTLPSELGNMTKVEKFHLGDNQLTGSLPNEFGDMSSLQFISLSMLDTSITGAGEILGKLQNLEIVDILDNDSGNKTLYFFLGQNLSDNWKGGSYGHYNLRWKPYSYII